MGSLRSGLAEKVKRRPASSTRERGAKDRSRGLHSIKINLQLCRQQQRKRLRTLGEIEKGRRHDGSDRVRARIVRTGVAVVLHESRSSVSDSSGARGEARMSVPATRLRTHVPEETRRWSISDRSRSESAPEHWDQEEQEAGQGTDARETEEAIGGGSGSRFAAV